MAKTSKALESDKDSIVYYFYKGGFYLAIFFLFSINLIALTLSLQCNKPGGSKGGDPPTILFRISSALFAFMFGLMYILMNYASFKVAVKGDGCKLCTKKPFIFF